MKNPPRIELIDSLRGFALLGIILIHGVEQFGFFYKTENAFLFPELLDRFVFDSVFFFISQKAYSIFAIMFGVSFCIQMENQERRGVDFRGKFIWRLFILLVIGILHRMIFSGEILSLYAVVGFGLILIYRLETKLLILISALLALQVPFIYQLILSFIDPDFVYEQLKPAASSIKRGDLYASGSFIEVSKFNIWVGTTQSLAWTYNTGRLYQLMSFFILGLVIGRAGIFNQIEKHIGHTVKVLTVSLTLCVLFSLLVDFIPKLELNRSQIRLLKVILNSYYHLFFTFTLILLFILIYQYMKENTFKYLAVYGRMSLSNYLAQTLLGTFFFYGYGLGMYQYLGYTWGLIYGILFFFAQLVFCNYWMKHFKFGPVEWLWRALTYFDFRLKIRK